MVMSVKPKEGRIDMPTGGIKIAKSAITILVIVVVFFLGIGIGNRRISVDNGHLRVDLHARYKSVTGLPSRLDYSSVDEVYESLKDNYNGTVTQSQLIDGLKHGLATATKDPYTVYFTAKEAQSFNNELNNTFSGIGAQLGLDADGNIEIIAPIDDLPAAKAGVMAKDIIAEINGASTSGLSTDEAVNKIRGPKGSKVSLKLVRNKTQVVDVSIVRDNIVLPSVKTKTLDGNIGYMQISTFADDTTALTAKAAKAFKDAGVKGIVLDLRNDPGGLLDAAVHVSSLWLPSGTNVLQEKRGSTVVQSYQALGGDVLNGIPTVILVNDGSASASEITAGALHDNKAAYIMGTKSYGKGVVQQLINFKDGSQLKVTIASWYRPDGENINHKGITPDKTVKLSADDIKNDTDAQLKAAQDYLGTK
jgi:carboxyl-terminal processing protease